VTPINDDTAVLPAVPASDEDPPEERDDGLAEALAKAAPKRWWNTTTVVLSAIVLDRKSTRLNSSHSRKSRMPSSA